MPSNKVQRTSSPRKAAIAARSRSLAEPQIVLTSSSDSGSDDNSDAPDRKVQKKKRNSAGSKKKVAQVVSDLSTDEEDAFTLSSGGSDAAASSTDDEEAVVQESDVPTTEDSDDAQDEFYGDEVKVLSMPSGAAAKQPLQKSLVSREAFESIVFVTDDQPPAVASAKVGSPSRRTMVQIRKTSTKGKGKVVDDPETTLPVASSSDEEEIEQKKVCLEHSHEAQVVIQSISSALEALTLGGTTTPSAASCPENAPEKPKRGRKPKVKAESDTVANKPVKKPASKKDAAPADTAHDNGSPSPSVFIIRKKGTHFHCPVPGCDKSFLNNNGLQYHLINFIHDPTGLLLWSFSAQQESEPADKEGAVSALLDTVPANLFPLLVPGFRYSFGSKKSQDHAMKWAPVKLSLAKAPGRAGKGGGGSKKADSLTFSGLPDKRIVVKRDKKWEESLGDLRSLLRSEYTVLPKDRGMAYVPRTSPLSVAVADKDSPVMISLFETLVVGKNRSWILNAGASVWGLDYAPLPSSSSSQFLAIGGYRSTVDEHHMVGDKMEPAFEHDPTMYGSIQIWRTDDEKSGPKIALCLVHEYGCVYDLKWCPFVTASTSNDMMDDDSMPRLGFLAVTFGDGVCRVFDVPDPNAFESKEENFPIFVQCREPFFEASMPNTLVWKVDWLDGSTLVTGSSDGQVAVWDIQSHLLGLNIASQSTLISSYPAHDCAIRKVSACPTSPNLFMTCGNDGRLFIHDIRQPWCPLRIHRIRAFMSGVSWCREKVVFADGDNMARVLVDGVEGHSENGFNKTQRSTAIARSVGYIWDISGSQNLPFAALCSTSLKLTNVTRTKRHMKSLDVNVYTLDYKNGTLFFKESQALQAKPLSLARGGGLVLEPPELTIQKITWNSNPGHETELASGGAMGFVRLDRFKN